MVTGEINAVFRALVAYAPKTKREAVERRAALLAVLKIEPELEPIPDCWPKDITSSASPPAGKE